MQNAVNAAKHEREDIYLRISGEFTEENRLYSKALLPFLTES